MKLLLCEDDRVSRLTLERILGVFQFEGLALLDQGIDEKALFALGRALYHLGLAFNKKDQPEWSEKKDWREEFALD